MDNFGLVDAIRTYCTGKGYNFFYGSSAYVNIEIDVNKYDANEVILIADFNCIPTYTNSKITELRYTGTIALGQKKETTTESSLDEKPIQKFDRRLKLLSNLLTTILGDLSCQNELEIVNANMRYDLNSFDLNADFVAISLTFVQ